MFLLLPKVSAHTVLHSQGPSSSSLPSSAPNLQLLCCLLPIGLYLVQIFFTLKDFFSNVMPSLLFISV